VTLWTPFRAAAGLNPTSMKGFSRATSRSGLIDPFSNPFQERLLIRF